MVASLADWNKLMMDKVNGPKILAYAKKSRNEENLKFLSLMKSGKKDASTYTLFIKKGAKNELNLPASMADKFHAVAASDIKKAPWDEATKEVLKMFTDNVEKPALK